MKYAFLFIFLALLLPVFPHSVHAQSDMQETDTLEKAKVTATTPLPSETIPDSTTPSPVQSLTALVLSGPDKGQTYTFPNDFTQLKVGETFYLRHIHNPNEGQLDTYSVADPYRLPVLYVLGAIFVALVFLFGGIQGVRGLATLVGSLLLIFYLLLPGITHGYSPVLVSIGVASLIILVGSYLTHGINRTTTAAVLGMLVTVVLTGCAAWYVVHAAQLSGYNSEDSTYIQLQYNGAINLVGLLLGGILIGLLGVLYDMAIGQAIAVEELMRAGIHLTKWQVYRRAIRIGREHIGALVNTLAIAYVGAALPLLLLIHSASAPLDYILNGEILATEIVRILIGGIGVVLAVPITTLIAVYLLSGRILPEGKPHGHSHH